MERDSAKSCLTQQERASTPPEIRKYRRSTNLEPGRRYQHYGLADDYEKLNLGDKIYGVTENNRYKIGASDLINLPKPSELQRINNIKAEKVYRQQNREPLGCIPDRGYVLPSKYTTGREAFGIKSVSSLEPAKLIIFPSVIDESEAGNELYKRSHGSYAPGEQKKYGYDHINPLTTRFGVKGNTIAFNGVSQNIAEVLNASANASKIVGVVNTKKVEDFRNMGDMLGQSKNLGQDSGMRPRDLVYGKPSGTKGLSAAEVLKGKYKEIDCLPDEDLGKSITPGFRNLAFTDRAYGCPSIRNDIPNKPIHTRSIADSQNYGDDVPAQDLINPPAFSDLSVGPLVMNEIQTKDKILSLFERIGYSFDQQLGDYLFDLASNGQEYATVNAFRNVLNEFIISQELKK